MIPVILFFVWGCGQWEGGLPENVVVRINQERSLWKNLTGNSRNRFWSRGKR